MLNQKFSPDSGFGGNGTLPAATNGWSPGMTGQPERKAATEALPVPANGSHCYKQ
jgi:hypothetical protein